MSLSNGPTAYYSHGDTRFTIPSRVRARRRLPVVEAS